MTQIRSKRSVERDKVSFSVHVNKTCAEENSASEIIVNFNDSPIFAHATFAATGQVLLPSSRLPTVYDLFFHSTKKNQNEKKISSLKAKCASKFNLFITKAKYFQGDKKDRQTVLINKTDK